MTTSKTKRRRVRFTIPLAPVPAARIKQSKWGAYYPARYEEFRKAARLWFSEYKFSDPPFDTAVSVDVMFVCKTPKKPAYPWPRGDIDNYEKALYDSITNSGKIWDDDILVTHAVLTKRYAEKGETPCIEVHIKEI